MRALHLWTDTKTQVNIYKKNGQVLIIHLSLSPHGWSVFVGFPCKMPTGFLNPLTIGSMAQT